MEEKNKDLHLRKATSADLMAIIKMLADDILGQNREKVSDPLDERYFTAFKAIEKNPDQDLLVMVNDHDEILGTLQITYLQYLNHTGSKRALIESVRIHSSQRGRGLGEEMFRLAIIRARENGADVVQLTSDKTRTEALRFYKKLGFTASHEGFKMKI
ncbi:GNAT family N-acetyltransferase [Chryseobacterium sp. T16E-39]|uniref:GNAT family N-acetyltransferase n=1 Tax=Chryseobacterium sp. T16E-39 TaxID=2015076 RepID=UPI000B5B2050|nr:GNAT family N-acetyltransferase [Chryseobacterium sp. T16E-39]ASK29975.1 GNAT family N-acetyltransferase [Chryseobacterium sp. T16E-39]